jgi:hypothetical protein
LGIVELRFEHVDAAVSGMIEDELSSKTIHNAVTLLRTILAGKKGPSALRRGVAFRDSILGLELPPLHSRQITPPTPEFDATHLAFQQNGPQPSGCLTETLAWSCGVAPARRRSIST